MQLGNSHVDSSQCISVLAATALPAESSNSDTTMDDFLKSISYDTIAAVLRQCDRSKSADRPSNTDFFLRNISASTNKHGGSRKKKSNKCLRPEKLADLKAKANFQICLSKGHWVSENNDDGTLRPDVVFIESKGTANTSIDSYPRRRTITFNLDLLENCHQECHFPGDYIGLLVDDGEPYKGIGLYEFSLLKSFFVPEWNRKLDSLPVSIVYTPYWQYGSGLYTSKTRRILGSVLLSVRRDEEKTLQIAVWSFLVSLSGWLAVMLLALLTFSIFKLASCSYQTLLDQTRMNISKWLIVILCSAHHNFVCRWHVESVPCMGSSWRWIFQTNMKRNSKNCWQSSQACPCSL